MTPTEKLAAATTRFWAQVHKTPNCWFWCGTVYGSNSYGRMWDGDKDIGAHRFSWLIHRGAIAAGMLVLHKCDTPTCVNPDHLFLGTEQDNADDMVAKGRQCCGDAHPRRKDASCVTGDRNGLRKHPEAALRGEHNGNSKLTSQSVREIREAYADGFSQQRIADSYGIAQSVASSIILRRTWKHVT